MVDAEPRGLCLAAIAEQAAALRNGPGCLSHDLLSQLVDAAEKLRLSLHSMVANYPRARDARQTVLRCAAVLEALDALLLRPTLLTLQLARDKEIVDALMQKVTAGEAARVAAHVVTLAVVVYGLAFDASRQVRHSAASGKTTAPGTKELQLPFFDGVQLDVTVELNATNNSLHVLSGVTCEAAAATAETIVRGYRTSNRLQQKLWVHEQKTAIRAEKARLVRLTGSATVPGRDTDRGDLVVLPDGSTALFVSFAEIPDADNLTQCLLLNSLGQLHSVSPLNALVECTESPMRVCCVL